MTIFISAVTAEFEEKRNQLADELKAKGHHVLVQRDFDTGGRAGMLARLRDAIDDSNIVVAMLGTSSGEAHPVADETRSFTNVMESLNFEYASFTQWEVYFALYFGKALVPIGRKEIFQTAQINDKTQSRLVSEIVRRGKRFECGPKENIVDKAFAAIEHEVNRQTGQLPQQKFKESHRAIADHAESLRSLAFTWLQQSANVPLEEEGIEDWFASRRATFPERQREPLDLPDGIYHDAELHANHDGPIHKLLFLGGPGTGKTTLIYQLMHHFSDLKRIERYKIVPVFANCLTLAPLMYSKPSADEAVKAWLQIAISPLLGTLQAKHVNVDNSLEKVTTFVTQVRETKYTLLILIDGLDEFDPSGNNRGDFAGELFGALDRWARTVGPNYVFIATTRPDLETQHLAATWGLQAANLEAPSERQIRRIAGKLLKLDAKNFTPESPELLDGFVKEFEGTEIQSALVYLQPLARYYREHRAEALEHPATRLKLMEIETNSIVRKISTDLEQAGHEEFDAAIRDMLLDIALRSLHVHDPEVPASLSRGSLADMPSTEAVPGLKGLVMDPRDRIVHRLLHVLIYDHRGGGREGNEFFYRLPHNEYRDYLLADGISRLVHGNPPLPKTFSLRQQLACSYLGAERVKDFLRDIIGGEHESRRRFALSLVELMNNHEALERAYPIERTAASPHGAMMSLLLSLGEFPDIERVNGKGVSFQRTSYNIAFRGRMPLEKDCSGASFRESNLQMANFRELTLDNADFDNTDLKGADLAGSSLQRANLRNVAMGASADRPTILTGTKLSQADLFNYRFQLGGFYHFWDLELGGDEAVPERYVLVAGSRGQILAFDLTHEDKLKPVTIQTAPRPKGPDEIMDLSRHPRQPNVIVITGRDSSVRILKLFEGSPVEWPRKPGSNGSDFVELEEIGRCEDVFHTKDARPYSRRARFSSSGEWLAVVARDERVAFFSVVQHGDCFKLLGPTFGREHTGPIMCIVAPASELSNGERPSDRFFTAGYDGRVAVWREERGREPECWLRAKKISDPAKIDPGGTIEIFRSLVPGASGELWSGTELSAWLMRYKFSEGGDGRWSVKQDKAHKFSEGVFALAILGDLLAVGLTGGNVKVFRASGGKDHYDWNEPILDTNTSDEIVRSLRFIQGGRHLLAATWDGCLFRFDLKTGKVMAQYEYPRELWQPQKDIHQIQFDENPFSDAEGISPRMREYLVQVQRARSNGK